MKQKSTWKVAKYEALESVILTVQRRGTLVISPNHCPCPLVQKCSGRQRDKILLGLYTWVETCLLGKEGARTGFRFKMVE